MNHAFLPRDLPPGLEALAELALDLRWTWSHAGDRLWQTLEPGAWKRTRNPWVILQNVSRQRLQELAGDADFRGELDRLVAEREHYLSDSGWCDRVYPGHGMRTVAYFSMEFGLSEALPLYAGGLGILAGDFLKAASDLALPVVGVGLLYQEGYFRQLLDKEGRQIEAYPYNDATSLPIQPVTAPSGAWLHVPLEFPGRTLLLRVWRANVGRLPLYLLDGNDPLNSPADRGITSKLYGGGMEMRFVQELVLGVGGWRALEALGVEVDVCHLNEGHAAFVVLERARRFMQQTGLNFWEALWATRAGNVFTTHTPVAAGFDTFPPALIDKYFPYFRNYLAQLGIPAADLLGLGRKDPSDLQEPFNMAYLALRGCSTANGVSRLHGMVSRRIFQPLYPRWPEAEVPVGHVTNGVHVPSWDSPWADRLWTESCGKERWLDTGEALEEAIRVPSGEQLWAFRAEERKDLVHYARQRLARHLGQRGAPPEAIAQADRVLDANALTLGFARRFTAYKRPNLLLADPQRLIRLLTRPEQPVQLIIAGKAHPEDQEGKRLLQAWAAFAQRPEVRNHAVLLEDYDMSLAQELVQGVDVWINTPRRPWEACGTSGMKTLANGGINLSELDGWWAEAYSPEVGWALGDGREHPEPEWDQVEAEQLYRLLEEQVIPEFYRRDAQGIPRAWVARMRASMARLAPRFSSSRMAGEYLDRLYLPAADDFRRRSADNGRLAQELHAWQQGLRAHWHTVRFGNVEARAANGQWSFTVQVYLGEIDPRWVQVELYAEPEQEGEAPLRQAMERTTEIPGALHGYLYQAQVPATRPSRHYTPRIRPHHPEVKAPIETGLILWPG